MEYHLKLQAKIEEALRQDLAYESENCYKAIFAALGETMLKYTRANFLGKLDLYIEHFRAQIETRRSEINLLHAQTEESEKKDKLT
jgi:hypothetical protein